jgi:hypothetical protein
MLVQSKWESDRIIPLYTINIFMDSSIYIMIFIIKKLHNINFIKKIIIGPKNHPKSNVPYFWNNYTILL